MPRAGHRLRRPPPAFDPSLAEAPQWGPDKPGLIMIHRASTGELKRRLGMPDTQADQTIPGSSPTAVGDKREVLWIADGPGCVPHWYISTVVALRSRHSDEKGIAVRYDTTGEIEVIPHEEEQLHRLVALHWKIASVRPTPRASVGRGRSATRVCGCGAKFSGPHSAQALGGHRGKCHAHTAMEAEGRSPPTQHTRKRSRAEAGEPRAKRTKRDTIFIS